MDQNQRSKIVVLAISLFVLLVGVFLLLMLAGSQPGAVTVDWVSKEARPSPAEPTITYTPWQSTGQAMPGAVRSLNTTVLPAKATATATAVVTRTLAPTSTPTAAPQIIQPQSEGTSYPLYIVREGDTFERLAKTLNRSPETIRSANFMYGDAITPGQALIIPPSDSFPTPAWRFSSMDKDRGNTLYPLTFETSRFRLHFMPDTYPSVDPVPVSHLIDQSVSFIEHTFEKPLGFSFDAYAAGTLFEQPDTYLLGRSYSQEHKIFFLYNGSGNAVSQQYMTTHELTHLYAWNVFGPPASFLVSEGAAVYAGMESIADSNFISLKTFCAMYKHEDRLPILAQKTGLGDFRGHNNNLVNYYASGCFAGYLLETYGVEKFGQVYKTNDFQGVYEKSIAQLETEWKDAIVVDQSVEALDARRYGNAVDVFMSTNADFFEHFDGLKPSILAYQALDRARLALLTGELDAFDQHMAEFQKVTGQ